MLDDCGARFDKFTQRQDAQCGGGPLRSQWTDWRASRPPLGRRRRCSRFFSSRQRHFPGTHCSRSSGLRVARGKDQYFGYQLHDFGALSSRICLVSRMSYNRTEGSVRGWGNRDLVQRARSMGRLINRRWAKLRPK